MGSRLDYLTAGGKLLLLHGWDSCPGAHKCCFCPLVSLPCWYQHAPHKFFAKTVKFGVCSAPQMWEMLHRARGSDPSVTHQLCATCSGILLAVSGTPAHAVSTGYFSYRGPTAGPGQCCVVGVCPTEALLWGLGSALQQASVLSAPCGVARHCVAVGVCPTKASRWGLGSALQRACVPQRPCCGA